MGRRRPQFLSQRPVRTEEITIPFFDFATQRAYGKRARTRALAEIGLRAASEEDLYGAHYPLFAQVSALPDGGTVAEFEALYQAAWESKESFPNGDRVYGRLQGWLVPVGEDVDDGDLSFVDPYARWFRDDPSPVSAALYATALHGAAFEMRGGAFSHETSARQWRGYEFYTGQATQILLSHEEEGSDHPLWKAARYNLTKSDGTMRSERRRLFEELWEMDVYNLSLIRDQMRMLLPRWFGRDPGEADRFARRALAVTEDRFGAGAYALAYWEYTSVGSLTVDDTHMDTALARQGFRDLLQLCGHDLQTINRFARTMSWANDEATVLEVFNSGLRLIDPSAWDGDTDEEAVDLALRAYMWAKNNA